jgi:hypothetical protein
MKAIVKNTMKSITKTPSLGFVEVIIFGLAIAILLMPLS